MTDTGTTPQPTPPAPSSKVPAETSKGTLYARPLVGGDLQKLEPLLAADGVSHDLARLGEAALVASVNQSGLSEDDFPLPAAVLTSLTETDLHAVAQAVAEANDVAFATGSPYEALGGALAPGLSELGQSVRALRSHGPGLDIAKAFPQIGIATGQALEKGLSAITSLREQVRSTSAFQQFAQGRRLLTRDDILNTPNDPLGIRSSSESALEAAKRVLEQNDAVQKAAAAMSIGVNGGAIGSATEHVRRFMEQQDLIDRAVNPYGTSISAALLAQSGYVPPPYDPPPIPHISETPMGRAAEATEESAKQLREVAQITAAMADGVGALTEAIVSQAIPEWLTKLASDREAEGRSLAQASSSLKWTKWTLIVSVQLTVAMTAWQLYVGKKYKEAADVGQIATDKAVVEQLIETRRTNDLLKQEIEALRAQASAFSSATAAKTKAARPAKAASVTSKR